MQAPTTILTKKAKLLANDSDAVMKHSFLNKLYSILSNKDIASVIAWSEEGDMFQIINSSRFQNEIIPKYFKHKNLKSFIRQLNLHGFKKLRTKSKYREINQDFYKHSFFRRDHPDLIAYIKRKISKPVESDEKNDQINNLIRRIKDMQEEIHQLSEVKNSEVYKVVDHSTNSEPVKLLVSALKVYQDFSSGQGKCKDEQQVRVYELTKNFIADLGAATNEKITSLEIVTAASIDEGSVKASNSSAARFISSNANEELGKRREDAWDITSESDFEELMSTSPKLFNGDNELYQDSDVDYDSVLQSHMHTDAEWRENFSGLFN